MNSGGGEGGLTCAHVYGRCNVTRGSAGSAPSGCQAKVVAGSAILGFDMLVEAMFAASEEVLEQVRASGSQCEFLGVNVDFPGI